jgi:hypothetical protein
LHESVNILPAPNGTIPAGEDSGKYPSGTPLSQSEIGPEECSY